MWHRFPQPLRKLILAALSEAARQNRSAAEPRDFLAVIDRNSQESPASKTPCANVLAPEALRLFELAYQQAAEQGEREIDLEHLLTAMGRGGGIFRNRGAWKRFKRRVTSGVDHLAKRSFARAKLSVVHPGIASYPHDLYDRIRAIAPVRRDPVVPFWIVTGYPEAVAVLRDPRFSSSPRSSRTPSGGMEVDLLPQGPVRRQLCVIAGVLTSMMVFSDPPEHSRIRAQIGQMFSPRIVGSMRQRAQQIADELIDQIISRGSFDVVEDFACPFPLMVVAEMLGIERDMLPAMRRWADAFGAVLTSSTTIRQDLQIRASMIELRDYVEQRVARLRATPDGSAMSQLIVLSGESLDLDALIANCFFLSGAGHVTTTSTMASGLRELLKNPSQLKQLVDDPSQIPAAVEELLRLHAPVQWTRRRALEDVELAGAKIKKDDMVLISLGAANRDARQFPNPHQLDITRENAAKHVTFSGGNHFCLGASLARLELQIAFATMLRRLKNMRIHDGFEVKWRGGHTLHGFDSLPIEFHVERQ